MCVRTAAFTCCVVFLRALYLNYTLYTLVCFVLYYGSLIQSPVIPTGVPLADYTIKGTQKTRLATVVV